MITIINIPSYYGSGEKRIEDILEQKQEENSKDYGE